MTKNWLFWSPFGLWWSSLFPVKLFPCKTCNWSNQITLLYSKENVTIIKISKF